MDKVVLSEVNAEGRFAYEYSDSLAAAGDGDWILIPADVVTVTVTCEG